MKTLASLAAVLVVAPVLVIGSAASAGEVRIAWSDLDLSTAAGAGAFDARLRSAARKMCRNVRHTGTLITDRGACEAAVRDEAVSLLPGAARVEYALSRGRVVA
jgi:UrcA family protein